MSGEKSAPAVREAGTLHGIPCAPGAPVAGIEEDFPAWPGGDGTGYAIMIGGRRQGCYR
jgi:hypothetical protein